MNLSIDMTPEMERLLISQAAKHGKDLQTYLSDAIRSQIITPLLAAEIHDRGRGPEIKGTRITVYDVLDYQRLGWRTDAIASHLRLTPAQVEKAFEYIEANQGDVEREYQQMIERAQRGNPPAILAALESSRANLMLRKESLRLGK